MKQLRRAFLVAGVIGCTFLAAASNQAMALKEPMASSNIIASQSVQTSIGADVLDYMRVNAEGQNIILLNRHDFSSSNDVKSEDILTLLIANDVDIDDLAPDEIEALARALNENHMVALKSRETVDAQANLCLMTTGVLERSVRSHIAELSSIPEALIENSIGTASAWQHAKLLHEFAHCEQPYQRRTLFSFRVNIASELDADQRMFDHMGHYDVNGLEVFLSAYRSARAVASIHFTGVSHHTNAALFLPEEEDRIGTIDAEMILSQKTVIENALAQRISRMTARNDLLLEAIEARTNFERAWFSDDAVTVERYPSLLADASGLSVPVFFDRYAEVDPRFLNAVRVQMMRLIKMDRDNYDTYETFYQAARSLLEDGDLSDNAYATRFLTQYVEGITLFMPSLKPDVRMAKNLAVKYTPR